MGEQRLRTTSKTEIIVVNEEGEVLDNQVTKNRIVLGSKEQFLICYVSMMAVIKNISGPAIKVYAHMLEHYLPGSPVVINRFVKEIMAQAIGSNTEGSLSTISNALAELCTAGLLFKREQNKGVYWINPRYAFKGSTTKRNESLKAIIELGCENC